MSDGNDHVNGPIQTKLKQLLIWEENKRGNSCNRKLTAVSTFPVEYLNIGNGLRK